MSVADETRTGGHPAWLRQVSIDSAVCSSPAHLQRTLRQITEVLAGELARPSASAPDWSPTLWRLARAVAALHGIAPLLSRALRWQGPGDWVAFLDAQRIHTEHRHTRIMQLLQNLDRELRSLDIGAVALKGVALHSMDVYRPGERPMADVDLLVHPRNAERAAGMLISLGFYEAQSSWKERAFAPVSSRAAADLGEHGDNDLKVELHERICEQLPLRITDVSEWILPAAVQPGLNAYPSAASLMMHLLLHAAGAMACRSLRMLQLQDIALLSARMTAADWDELLQSRNPGQSMGWAWPPLAMTDRYYSLELPAHARAALQRACPRALGRLAQRRQVTDMSYSYPRIDAFPGIEWSQSLRDTVAFVLSRIRPSDPHLALRETIALTQRWATGDQWSSQSQVVRIARWIFARPMRPVTLHAVRAALADAP